VNKLMILSKVQLYIIADPSLCFNRDLIELIPLAIEGGAQMVQFRDKNLLIKSFLKKPLRFTKSCREKIFL